MITTDIHGVAKIIIERNKSEGTPWTTLYLQDKDGKSLYELSVFYPRPRDGIEYSEVIIITDNKKEKEAA